MKLHRPHPATVIAGLALVVAAAQPAYAALARNSVGSPQIRNHAVKQADLGRGAVTSAAVKNGAVGLSDLAPTARPVKALAGGWTDRTGYVDTVNALGSAEPTVLGSLASAKGTGALRTPAATLVVSGQLSIQARGGTGALLCRILVDGTAVDSYSYASEASFSMMPVGAVSEVAAGTHDVALACSGNADAGNVQVSVVAVPR